MTLRGKDFCNCDHAHMLREAIVLAVAQLRATPLQPGDAYNTLQCALDTDHAACIELWGDLREVSK